MNKKEKKKFGFSKQQIKRTVLKVDETGITTNTKKPRRTQSADSK